MILTSVYTKDTKPTERAIAFLYRLLAERTPEESISHRALPTLEEHRKFVGSHPYMHWYLMEVSDIPVGACYLTWRREIGIFRLRLYKGLGYGRQAVVLLMKKHPGKFYANVNPLNTASQYLFQSLGGKVIQWTYELASGR